MSLPNFGEDSSADPTSDFLARERAALGADANLFSSGDGALMDDKDFERSASNFPALDGEDDGGAALAAAAVPVSVASPTSPGDATAGGGSLLDLDALGGRDEPLTGQRTGAAPNVSVTANDEISSFEQEYPAIEEPLVETEGSVQQNGFIPPPAAPYSQSATPYTGAYMSAGEEETEAEPIREWRERQKEEIRRRDEESERKKEESIHKAEKDIDEFYAEYNAKKEKNIAANKEEETRFLAEAQSELASGTTWSRVSKLIDLQNSQSKTNARTGPGAKDLSRMKEILLSLRREGETAPGAAGY